jgi:hypothetical protein
MPHKRPGSTEFPAIAGILLPTVAKFAQLSPLALGKKFCRPVSSKSLTTGRLDRKMAASLRSNERRQ